MSRYSKEHYEDAAKALKENRAWAIKLDSPHARGVMAATIGTFADLFAADNPPTCGICGQEDGMIVSRYCFGASGTVVDSTEPHPYTGGFNREKFLAACGLETVDAV